MYPALYAKATHTVAKPGDKIAVAGLDWRIVTSAGETLKTPLPGGGKANPYCASFKPQEVDKSENAQSVGSVITFGKFRVAHLGDVTWNKEFDLMCPNNPIGTVDLFVVSHHGQAISNSEVLVHALAPRVGIINNGTRKGGQPDAMRILHSSPGLEDLWQLHFSQLSGQEYTVPGMFIANSTDDPPDRHAHRRHPGAAAGSGRAAAAGAQRRGLLGQGVGAGRWIVHGHQRAQRFQQDVPGALEPENQRPTRRMGHTMKRRDFLTTVAATGAAAPGRTRSAQAPRPPIKRKGRLKQSLFRTVFGQNTPGLTTFDEQCREAARLGAYGFELIPPADWPTMKKYGLVPTMGPMSFATIPTAS